MTRTYRALAGSLWLFSTLASAEAQPTIAAAHAFIAQQLAHAEVTITALPARASHFTYSGYRGHGCRSTLALRAAQVAADARPGPATQQLLVITWQAVSDIPWQAASDTRRRADNTAPSWLDLAGDISIGGASAAGVRLYFADSATAPLASLAAAMGFLRNECKRSENFLQRME